MDEHAAVQHGWALQYEQLSSGQFKGRIHHVQLPEVTLVREDTNMALRQRGRLDDKVYGFAMALQDSSDLFFNGQRVPENAIMCGKGDELDLTTPAKFSLIALVVDRSLLNTLWERMYQKPLAHWLETQLVLQTTSIKAQNLRELQLTVLDQASALAKLFASSAAMKHTVEAVQIHGGYGFVKEYHVERLMRDAKITQIYEGTSEVQKIVISRGVLSE
jgi:AraC family ethanolamine operon transcriptional activator